MQTYTKKDGTVSFYPTSGRDYLAHPNSYKRGPHLYGKARRVKRPNVERYVIDIGRTIRDRRLEAGISVDELAAGAGISRYTLHKIENSRGTKSPNVSTIVALALALRISPSEIMP